MTKKGFTLMELLVSIFITGMVMLSLVAMWRTSSNQTAQAQRQSIIRNENTIFLRRFYSDFVSASEVICPWAYVMSIGSINCNSNEYIAVKNAVIKPENGEHTKLMRITGPYCGTNNNEWATNNDNNAIIKRCIKPTYVVYKFQNNGIYRCTNTFLDNDSKEIEINTLISNANSYCNNSNHNELIMPYVSAFQLGIVKNEDVESFTIYPELLIDYTVNREFGADIPAVSLRFTHLFTKKRGV